MIKPYSNLTNKETLKKCEEFVEEYIKKPSSLTEGQRTNLVNLASEIGKPVVDRYCSSCLRTAIAQVKDFIQKFEGEKDVEENIIAPTIENNDIIIPPKRKYTKKK